VICANHVTVFDNIQRRTRALLQGSKKVGSIQVNTEATVCSGLLTKMQHKITIY